MNDNDGEPPGVRQALERLGQLIKSRDMAIADAFAPDGVLVGSEPGEMARGHGELVPFFKRFFAQPTTATWEWDSLEIRAIGQIGWLFAEGWVVLEDVAGIRRLPYRLSGVLEPVAGAWKWRLFHGSEPKV